jgi:hypothetical protein
VQSLIISIAVLNVDNGIGLLDYLTNFDQPQLSVSREAIDIFNVIVSTCDR